MCVVRTFHNFLGNGKLPSSVRTLCVRTLAAITVTPS